METIIIANALILLFAVLAYIIWNLYTKNVKLEVAVLQRDVILVAMSDLIEASEKKLREVDRLGAFKSDDEIGFFFTTVMQIQEELNKFKV